jgi:hypothetical protein
LYKLNIRKKLTKWRRLIMKKALSQVLSTAGCLCLGLGSVQGMIGHLVAKIGMPEAAAIAAIAALSSGGAVIVEAMWPLLIPFIGTLEFLVAFVGTGAAVGF